MRSFRIKICGINTISDAMRAIESGADAIGLNFYEKSLRNVNAIDAMDISAAISTAVATVGVFVNSPASDISELAEHLRLSAVQLHGDEDPAIMNSLDGISVIRAIRVPTGDATKSGADKEKSAADKESKQEGESENATDDAPEFFDSITRAVQLQVDRWVSVGVSGILLDAYSAEEFGGTGTMFNWKIASRLDVPVPFVLAGGLDPQNVGDAILGVKPDAVDVASGVEKAPGVKDPGKMIRFTIAAREAFHQLKEQAENEQAENEQAEND